MGDADAAAAAQASPREPYTLFKWVDGTHRRVPEDFHFPKGNALIAWQLWCCGNTSSARPWPPYRLLHPTDMPPRAKHTMRKRLCDFRYLMTVVEQRIVAEEVALPSEPTPDEAMCAFMECASDLLERVTDRKRKRRVPATPPQHLVLRQSAHGLAWPGQACPIAATAAACAPPAR